jgi:hypothetical protein
MSPALGRPDVCTLLSRLIAAAEAYVTNHHYAVTRADLAELCGHVDHEVVFGSSDNARFVGPRSGGLADLLRRADICEADERPGLLAGIGALLPAVRAEYHAALAARDRGKL